MSSDLKTLTRISSYRRKWVLQEMKQWKRKKLHDDVPEKEVYIKI